MKEEERKKLEKPISTPGKRFGTKIPVDLGFATAAALELRNNKLVLALVLERFREEPFAHKIDLVTLSREIIEDDRLCLNPTYNNDLVIKTLSKEVVDDHYRYLILICYRSACFFVMNERK